MLLTGCQRKRRDTSLWCPLSKARKNKLNSIKQKPSDSRFLESPSRWAGARLSDDFGWFWWLAKESIKANILIEHMAFGSFKPNPVSGSSRSCDGCQLGSAKFNRNNLVLLSFKNGAYQCGRTSRSTLVNSIYWVQNFAGCTLGTAWTSQHAPGGRV